MSIRTPVNQREFRVVGLSRSGTHAIINWLLAQVDGRYCFLNCAEPGTNPFHSARTLDSGHSYRTNIPRFDLRHEQEGRVSARDVLVHGYDDCLGMVCSRDVEQRHNSLVGASGERLDVLILRGPFNLFASRKKAGISREAAGAAVVTWPTVARIWKQHARAFLREKVHSPRPLVVINYNRWARERSYRRELATQLGVSFNDAGFRAVPAVASGSSFDGTRYHGQPEKMDILQRWRHFRDNPHTRSLFADDLVQLSRRIFGPVQDMMSAPAVGSHMLRAEAGE